MGRQPICLPQLTAFYLKTQVKLFCGCDALRVCAAWNRRGKKVQWFPGQPSWLEGLYLFCQSPQLLHSSSCPGPGVLGKVFKEGVRAHVQLANSVYCGALRWVVRFSPTQAAGTERSPVMMPTTSSFYKGPPREGKPPTDAGLSSKAKCTQALLLNLSSRLCLHGGWDPEGGATFGVWTDSGAVVGVWAGPGPGTQKRPALAGHCQRGDGGASLTQGVPAPPLLLTCPPTTRGP